MAIAAVTQEEVKPGLVVHVDTAILRGRGGSVANAGQDRAVQGPHYFLVLQADGVTCVAAPLFSKSAPGSDLLDETKKAGLPDKWVGQDTYTSRWQHWRIPLANIEAASSDEESRPTNRRTYAADDPAELERILSWQEKNRNGYRPV